MKGILLYTEYIENSDASKMENKIWNKIISHTYKVLFVKKSTLKSHRAWKYFM